MRAIVMMAIHASASKALSSFAHVWVQPDLRFRLATQRALSLTTRSCPLLLRGTPDPTAWLPGAPAHPTAVSNGVGWARGCGVSCVYVLGTEWFGGDTASAGGSQCMYDDGQEVPTKKVERCFRVNLGNLVLWCFGVFETARQRRHAALRAAAWDVPPCHKLVLVRLRCGVAHARAACLTDTRCQERPRKYKRGYRRTAVPAGDDLTAHGPRSCGLRGQPPGAHKPPVPAARG